MPDPSRLSYTSYPNADRFVEACAVTNYARALEQRRIGTAVMGLPLTLYLNIPFVESPGFHCECNKTLLNNRQRVLPYLRALGREVDLVVERLGPGQAVSGVHVGGGMPTFLTDEELASVVSMLRRSFRLASNGEYSLKVDPQTVDGNRLAILAELGFNRLSMGLQDFAPAAHEAVHRVERAGEAVALFEAARNLRFQSITTELIYGLPQQTSESFDSTLTQATALRPDHIALHAHACASQRLDPNRPAMVQMPLESDTAAMLSRARALLEDAGYVHVGMDQFALADDPLVTSKWQGRLHRNFQGYSDQPDSDLIGLGVSAIGRIGAIYSQNARTLDEYLDCLNQGRLPIVRGLALSRDDLLRRTVIMALLCQGEVPFEPVEQAYLIDFSAYFAPELQVLQVQAGLGLVVLDGTSIQVTPAGWLCLSDLAAIFDRYRQADLKRARFSKII